MKDSLLSKEDIEKFDDVFTVQRALTTIIQAGMIRPKCAIDIQLGILNYLERMVGSRITRWSEDGKKLIETVVEGDFTMPLLRNVEHE